MIESAIKYIKEIFADDCSGHDYHHTMRVYHSGHVQIPPFWCLDYCNT